MRKHLPVRAIVATTTCASIILVVSACVLAVTPGSRATTAAPAAATTTNGSDVVSDVATARAEIVKMMSGSARAWNNGDLGAFMNDYESDSSTTYIGRSGVVRGRAAIHDVYAPRFAPGGVRDSLSFENVEVDLLAPNVANVIAYYRLMRGDSTTSHGPTSLVMRRNGGRWRIVHDHSS